MGFICIVIANLEIVCWCVDCFIALFKRFLNTKSYMSSGKVQRSKHPSRPLQFSWGCFKDSIQLHFSHIIAYKL